MKNLLKLSEDMTTHTHTQRQGHEWMFHLRKMHEWLKLCGQMLSLHLADKRKQNHLTPTSEGLSNETDVRQHFYWSFFLLLWQDIWPKHLKEGRASFGFQLKGMLFTMAGTGWCQECEAFGHITPIVSKQRWVLAFNWLAHSPFLSSLGH